MKQHKPTSTTATPKPSIFQQYRQKKGAINTDKMYIYWFATKTNKIREYTPDIDIGDKPPIPTHEICSGRRPNKKYLSAIPEQGRRT